MRCLKGHRSYHSLNLQIGLLTNMQITTTLEWSLPSLKRIRSRIFEKVFQELLCPKFLPSLLFYLFANVSQNSFPKFPSALFIHSRKLFIHFRKLAVAHFCPKTRVTQQANPVYRVSEWVEGVLIWSTLPPPSCYIVFFDCGNRNVWKCMQQTRKHNNYSLTERPNVPTPQALPTRMQDF